MQQNKIKVRGVGIIHNLFVMISNHHIYSQAFRDYSAHQQNCNFDFVDIMQHQ